MQGSARTAPRRRLAAVVTAVLLVTGCAQGDAPDGATPVTQDAGAGTGFTNPVWNSNFPDPDIVEGEDGYVALATNGNGMNVQTLTSSDLVSWRQGSDAMPDLADWTAPGRVWAPETAQFGDSSVLYYTSRILDPDIQCIGVAVADEPVGPYVDSRPEPLVCEKDKGGSIDASPFIASDGTAYLYWKNDGNAVGVDTWISVQRLSPTGTDLVGAPRQLLKQDQGWEGKLVEAPSVWEHEGVFHLFYSANDFGSDRYAVGHATSESPLGPFVKTPEPVLESSDDAAGPGHSSLVEKDGRVWMVYHAWAPDAVGSEVPGRTMWLSEVTFEGRSVRVGPATTEGARRP